MTATHGEPSDGEGMAGRLVLVIDATVPAAVHQASATLAARLADEAGLPVTVATAPGGRRHARRAPLGRGAAGRGRGRRPRAARAAPGAGPRRPRAGRAPGCSQQPRGS